MIAAFIFDIDNTLYDYDAAHAAAYRALTDYAQRELGLSAERFNALHRAASRTLSRHTGGKCAAVHNRLIRYQLMLEQIGRPLSRAPEMAQLYWSTLLSHAVPYPDAAQCFDRLRSEGYTVGIGTNMTADYQFAKLNRLGLLDRVDFIVSSEEASAEKPAPRFFACCVEKAGCAAERCVFIGDDLQNDVLGAREAGLQSVWLRRETDTAAPAPDVRSVRALSELPDLLPLL